MNVTFLQWLYKVAPVIENCVVQYRIKRLEALHASDLSSNPDKRGKQFPPRNWLCLTSVVVTAIVPWPLAETTAYNYPLLINEVSFKSSLNKTMMVSGNYPETNSLQSKVGATQSNVWQIDRAFKFFLYPSVTSLKLLLTIPILGLI